MISQAVAYNAFLALSKRLNPSKKEMVPPIVSLLITLNFTVSAGGIDKSVKTS